MQKQAKEIKNIFSFWEDMDLEMQTIVQILTDRNVIFKGPLFTMDNALLSQYEEEIQQYGNKEPFIIYGVELKEDITPPLTIFELITIMNMLPILRHWNK